MIFLKSQQNLGRIENACLIDYFKKLNNSKDLIMYSIGFE